MKQEKQKLIGQDLIEILLKKNKEQLAIKDPLYKEALNPSPDEYLAIIGRLVKKCFSLEEKFERQVYKTKNQRIMLNDNQKTINRYSKQIRNV